MEQEYYFENGYMIPIEHVKSYTVDGGKGVWCSEYKFVGDNTRDLALILIDKDGYTPEQMVNPDIDDECITIEGSFSGNGELSITRKDGTHETFILNEHNNGLFSLNVYPGDTMQWFASREITLSLYEICKPMFSDGRFINLQK